MRRLIVCNDGTWNRPDQQVPTNVARMSLMVAPQARDGTDQIVFYDEGIGTGNVLDRLTGGAFGWGLDKNIEDGYRFLVNNYADGDEIFLFGFSRGAYTVRSLGGLIRKCGLLKKAHAGRFRAAYELYRRRDPTADLPDVTAFRQAYSREVNIRFIGVWDTVGALGVPLRRLRVFSSDRYLFHDTQLSGRVKSGYHAVAIDERRRSFEPTLWSNPPKPGQVVEQVWFAGVHSDVGGGYSSRGLADVALAWLIEKAKSQGLGFLEEDVVTSVLPAPLDTIHDSRQGIFKWLPGRIRPIGQKASDTEAVHRCAVVRHKHPESDYAPPNLVEYLEKPGARLTG